MIYQYWGKAAKNEDGKYDYHLLVYHCLDVAAVGEILISEYITNKKDYLENNLLTRDTLKSLYLFFLCNHDLGKFFIVFQNIIKELLLKLQNKTSKLKYEGKNKRHDQLGWNAYFDFVREFIIENVFIDEVNSRVEGLLDVFAHINFGHHGVPPKEGSNSIELDLVKNDRLAICSFIKESSKLFLSDHVIEEIIAFSEQDRNRRKEFLLLLKQFSWELAGISVLSDWLASGNGESLVKEEIQLNEYYEKYAKPRAISAVKKAGILRSNPANEKGFSNLFPDFLHTPTPLQRYCDDVFLHKQPQLWILEDVTGSGKTEAALTLVSRLLNMGLGNGCFIALPTMATSNAMYERMENVYHLLFDEKELPSLVLSHGARHLSKKFRESYRDIAEQDTTHLNTAFYENNQIHCSTWIADSNKKALLADVGVGTIDQTLMAILPVRYQSLRRAGMSRKILIFDEVHSFDAYTLYLLEKVLIAHASTGGSAILLSATLPRKVRTNFINAYQKGFKTSHSEIPVENQYPLATNYSKDYGISEMHMETRKEVKRFVRVLMPESLDDVVDIITKAVKAEQCVCWIRNTINDILDAYEILKFIIPDEKLDIFHSRFVLGDRIDIESKVLNLFGKKSGPDERKGRLLLASQVVEQSLDLDFDVLITDLAPIDLIIQRAGRLHRHLRNNVGECIKEFEESDRSAPTLYVHIPPEEKKPTAKWFSSYFNGASYVYEDTAMLWRTKEILKREGAIRMPDDARLLVEGVYSDEVLEVPSCFLESENKSWSKAMAKSNLGSFNTLQFDVGYCNSSSFMWNEDEGVPTRLGDKQTNYYLCRKENDKLVPLIQSEFSWEMSCIRLRTSMISEIDFSNEIQVMIERMKTEKQVFKFSEFIVFSGEKQVNAIDKQGNNLLITYNNKFGLKIEKEGK